MIQAPYTDPDTGQVAPSAIVRIKNVQGSLDGTPLIVTYAIYYSVEALNNGKTPIKDNLQLTISKESIITNWVPALKTQGYNELMPQFPGGTQV